MNRFDWLPKYVQRLEEEGIVSHSDRPASLEPVQRLELEAEDWQKAASVAAEMGLRWAAVWGDEIGRYLAVHVCLAFRGDYLALRCKLPLDEPSVASWTPYFPAANRMERHLRDMYGITVTGHPDTRRWTRHQAWPQGIYPLRSDFSAQPRSPRKTPADSEYPFQAVLGSGVYEIPVGPVHAGIIEPGHFRFQAIGEEVLGLEERLGFVHKGIEKIAVGRDSFGLARLAGRVSGDTTVAHTWAACMAMERVAGVVVPERGLVIRAILAERERVANHLGDTGAICNDVGFAFAHMQFSRLREAWQRTNYAVFGHRLLMDRIVPGGTACDLTPEGFDALLTQNKAIANEVDSLFAILDDDPALQDRLVGTGCLVQEAAERLGVVGYVGKASGIDYDVRRDHGYPPYNGLNVVSPCLVEGDVAARVRIRIEEIRCSLELINQLLQSLPDGMISVPWPENPGAGEGLALVEGWRGEILCHVRLAPDGRVARYFPRDPSWFSWPALEQLIHGNIVPDFPVCNKSVNGSYSGQDL